MATFMLENVSVKSGILEDRKYDYIFSVESVNNLALSGVPFREAYKQVGLAIERGEFKPERSVNHTHEGSIGNLCNIQIAELMNGVLSEFNFKRVEIAESELLR